MVVYPNRHARRGQGLDTIAPAARRAPFGDHHGFLPRKHLSGIRVGCLGGETIGRPVKWICDRYDAFATDFHGRDLTSEAELALDEDGRFLALRATNTSNLGASAISFVPLAKGIALSSSVYDIPCSYMRGRAVVTITAPTSAYRSAGRPEVVFSPAKPTAPCYSRVPSFGDGSGSEHSPEYLLSLL